MFISVSSPFVTGYRLAGVLFTGSGYMEMFRSRLDDEWNDVGMARSRLHEGNFSRFVNVWNATRRDLVSGTTTPSKTKYSFKRGCIEARRTPV